MSFTLNGSIITQSGVDNQLSSIGDIGGVETVVVGLKNIYKLGNKRLIVTGELTYNPDFEQLDFTNIPFGTCPVSIPNGNLNIVSEYTKNGQTRYGGGTGISNYINLVGKNVLGSQFEASSVVYTTGTGTFNWRGGTIESPIPFAQRGASATTNIKNGVLDCSRGTHNSVYGLSIGHKLGGNFNIDGLTVYSDTTRTGIMFAFDNPFNLFKGVQIYHGDGLVTTTSVPRVEATFEDYEPIGANYPVGFWTESIVTLKNSPNGSDISYVGGIPVSSLYFYNRGIITFDKDIKIKVIDQSKNPLENVKIYVPDYDDNNRQVIYGKDYRADLDTVLTTDSNGEVKHNVLLATVHKSQGAVDENINPSYRGINKDRTDEFDFRFCSYTKEIAVVTEKLKGVGVLEKLVTLNDDDSVTESDISIVIAYNTQETPKKAYDQLKVLLLDNYNGEFETIVSRSGDTLDCRNYNVNISSGSGQPTFNNDNITLYADNFVGNIVTNGNITIGSDVSVTGSMIDANNDSSLVFKGVDSWIAYNTKAARDLDSDRAGSGTVDSFRFNYSGGTIYIRLKVGTQTVFDDVTPQDKGITTVELNTQAQLAVLISGGVGSGSATPTTQTFGVAW